MKWYKYKDTDVSTEQWGRNNGFGNVNSSGQYGMKEVMQLTNKL